MGIVVGRDAEGRRFAANTPSDPATLAELESREQVGRPGTVTQGPNGLNLFTPA
jgi:acetyl-CoA C-acetyltransferase